MREDWIECNLDEVCEIQTGKYDANHAKIDGNYRFYTCAFDYLKCNTNRFGGKSIILPGNGANVGEVFYYDGEFDAYQRTYVINDIKIDAKYIYYNLKGFWKIRNIDKQFGSATNYVRIGNFTSFILNIAPLPIQRAIVSKIEALFSDLDNGIANFKKAQEQLKIYRQAVLKKAFEGKFTNGNIKDDELPKGWKWVNSGEFFSFVTSGSRGWAKYYSESGSIFIRITNLNFDTLNLDLRTNKIQYVNPPKNSEGLRTKVEEGDFLFSITGYLGMFAIAPKLESAFVNQHVCLCRPKDTFNKKYLAYWITAKSGGHYYLNKNQKGAVKAGLNLDDLKTFPVPLPPTIEEQNQIVAEIESRLSVCDKVEQSINESIEKAEALRQSILKKAFEGKLLSQAEIELCKKEADYEPASELLKKIQAEKAERITNGKLRITKSKKAKE